MADKVLYECEVIEIMKKKLPFAALKSYQEGVLNVCVGSFVYDIKQDDKLIDNGDDEPKKAPLDTMMPKSTEEKVESLFKHRKLKKVVLNAGDSSASPGLSRSRTLFGQKKKSTKALVRAKEPDQSPIKEFRSKMPFDQKIEDLWKDKMFELDVNHKKKMIIEADIKQIMQNSLYKQMAKKTTIDVSELGLTFDTHGKPLKIEKLKLK